jgi:hypothetical protein
MHSAGLAAHGLRHPRARAADARACGGGPGPDGPAPVGGKTKITQIDEGLGFLGWHIQRHRKRGTDRQHIYTYPSRKAIKAVTATVKTICRRNVSQPLQILIRQLNPALRGWCARFRPGVSAAAFADLARYTWTGSCDGHGARTARSP